ncbi:MAG: ribonuclease T2 [Acidobacteriota bacterium]
MNYRLAFLATTAIALPIFFTSCSTANTSKGQSDSNPQSVASDAAPANSSRGHRKHSERGVANARATGTTGKFDFYVMSLSWSPGFCATPAGRNDDIQCGQQRHFAFVLHGLWPQYEQKGWPEDCTTERIDNSTVERMLDIMPSPKLVLHEWEKHGTCSGLAPTEYFAEAREAFDSVKIPAKYQHPSNQISVNPEELRREFAEANPKFGHDGFAVLCSNNGRYLQEVRACLYTDLDGRACNREVLHDECRSDAVIMRPVR